MRYEEYLNVQLGKIKDAGLVDPGELLDIDLYIDQVENFFRKRTDVIDSETVKRYLSKGMINTYAKHGMIPRPDGKKYTKDHILMIAMTGYLRGIFKIDDVKYLMKPLVDNYSSDFDEHIDAETVYRTACAINGDFAESLADDIDKSVSGIKKLFEDNELDDERLEAFTLILSLAVRADMEKYIATRLAEKYFIEPANEKQEKIKRPKAR